MVLNDIFDTMISVVFSDTDTNIASKRASDIILIDFSV